jgi:hypothetical protein
MSVPESERTLRARLAAHQSWANTTDRAARTAKARKAQLERFEREVDPDGVLTPAERATRAEHARKAHLLRLSLKSAASRRKARDAAVKARAAEAELDTFHRSGVDQ